MRALLVWLVLPCLAHAEPAVTLEWEPTEPILQLDPALRTEIEAIGADETVVDRSIYTLGPHARAQTQTTLWTNDRDVRANGWTVAARISRDLGWNLTLTIDAGLSRMLGGIDRDNGTYGSAGIAISRLFHWSHHRVAWISLGVDISSWFGTGAPRLPSAVTAGLHVGTTF